MPDPHPMSNTSNEMSNVLTSSSPTSCLTKNRIIAYSSGELRAIICPMSPQRTSVVEVFSIGWEEATLIGSNISLRPQDERVRKIVVEFVAREPGSYAVSWLEVGLISYF
jgi:hypothetical protein